MGTALIYNAKAIDNAEAFAHTRYMTTKKALISVTELQAGDVFNSIGSKKQYRVEQVVPAHRAEYTFAVYCQSLGTGRNSTVVWPNEGRDHKVEVER